MAVIVGTNGNDALEGTHLRDLIDGLDGRDVILGLGGTMSCGAGAAMTRFPGGRRPT